MIKCSIHGLSVITVMCEHIQESLMKNILPDINYVPYYRTVVCNDCFTRNKFDKIIELTPKELNRLSEQEQEQEQIDKKLDFKYDQLKTHIKCGKCLDELYLKVKKEK